MADNASTNTPSTDNAPQDTPSSITSDSNETTRVSICAITCLRPDGLLRLLEGLDRQQFDKRSRPSLHVFVVDNDRDGSARDVVENFSSASGLSLHYDIEPQRGIPFARNHAVGMAMEAGTDYVAIIDDDEVPEPDWLDELLDAIDRHGADIVTGPVIAHYVEPAPAWVEEGAFFVKRGPTDGQDLGGNYQYVYTSNLLSRSEVFRRVRFNESLANNGSDDTHLFMQIHEAGFRIAWAEHASVTEWIPPTRVSSQWLCQRAYRVGNGFALCEWLIRPSWKTRLQRAAKGCARSVQGAFGILATLGRKAKHVQAWRRLYLGLGMIAGALGSRYEEYNDVHKV